MRRTGVFACSLVMFGGLLDAQRDGDWPSYGRDAGGERFSPLAHIRRENVASLQVAWTFRTGDAYRPARGRPTAFEATPLHVDDTLYLSTPVGRVIALDPVTGQQRWAFDANVPRDAGYGDFASRGVSMWQRGSERRIFVATIDARLIALDARTGQPVQGFGQRGTIDLRKGLRIAPSGFADYQVTSPPAVVGNTIVVGSAIQDGATTAEPSGEVRGFDAVTGTLKWSWEPIPQAPSAVGANTWKHGSAARTGAANAWSVIVADPARNLVFVPTGSPSPDYFGGERLGDNLFANSVVALRADTGTRVWHFQTVHHDLWDYDVASPPILFDWHKDGRTAAAVGVASKTGHLFVLDRETGEPLIPVEERPVPKSDVPGEEASPTQPFPTAPPSLARTALTAEDAWGLTDEDRAWCRETMRTLRSDGLFTPPSLRGTLVVPGNVGGMAWGGIAHDRTNNLLIMPVNNIAAEVRLIARGDVDAERKAGRLGGDFEYAPQRGTPYALVRRLLLGPKALLPCTPPPWGTLTAIKAATGEMAWQVPLGQFPGTEKVPDAPRWGSIALGGPIVTAGGLVFTAGTLEAAMYAFDVRTGQQLWKGTLPTSARSTPMTYLGRNGRQYVVISAGGHGVQIGPPLGDHVVAFALPDTQPSAADVRPGIEMFLSGLPPALRGKRVGLITNHTGIDRSRTSDIDLIAQHEDLRLVALLAPEHGIRGNAEAGVQIVDETDPKTGVPVYSLYMAEDRGPTPEMLKDVDVLVYDLQEVGGRTWTYVSTMALSMQAAAKKRIPFVVLDRPNPIGGEIVEGALLDPRFKSFVGMYPIPARHGMTVGELATLFNQKYGIGADLIVARVANWRRSHWFDQTGLPWVNPSPNLRSLAALTSYPGSVYFEGTNLTEGRGTDRPFEQVGAAWLHAPEVVRAMNGMRLPGIRFEAITMPVAHTAAKFKGQTIPAIRFAIIDRQAYRPVRTSLLLIDEIRRQHPRDFAWGPTIDRLTGSDKVRLAIDGGRLLLLLEAWDREAADFLESRKPFLLYP